MVTEEHSMQAGEREQVGSALALERVSFGYDGEPVLHEVSLQLAQGELVGLLGPNGAGKTTLLRLASGLLAPAGGRVLLVGHPLRGLTRATVARNVAVVPQDFAVQFAYTVRQIVALGRMPHRGLLGTATPTDRRAVARALAATHTDDLADRVFNELSGGERQRVLLALALAQESPIVLLDEPTAHLDVKHQTETLELLRRLNRERGITVLAALHDLNLAARYFPRLLLLHHTILADGPPAEVLDAALLSRVYGTPVQVGILRGEEHLSVLPVGTRAPTGQAEALPTPGRPEQPPPTPLVHVFVGGGSGELLMRALADAGISFTAGPLNVGDSDYALAERLAAATLVEPPSASISAQSLAAAHEALGAARAVVVCPTPLGHGNLALLDLACDACRAGAVVVLLNPGGTAGTRKASVAARDFTGRGPELYAALEAAGARWANSPREVLALLGEAGMG